MLLTVRAARLRHLRPPFCESIIFDRSTR